MTRLWVLIGTWLILIWASVFVSTGRVEIASWNRRSLGRLMDTVFSNPSWRILPYYLLRSKSHLALASSAITCCIRHWRSYQRVCGRVTAFSVRFFADLKYWAILRLLVEMKVIYVLNKIQIPVGFLTDCRSYVFDKMLFNINQRAKYSVVSFRIYSLLFSDLTCAPYSVSISTCRQLWENFSFGRVYRLFEPVGTCLPLQDAYE